MALTLDPTLLAAQDSLNRRPICELTVGKGVADFPFVGHDLANPGPQHQDLAQPVFLSDGRLALLYAGRHPSIDYGQLRLVVSDPARTEFGTAVAVDEDSYRAIQSLDAIVLTSSDTLGVVAYYATDRLRAYTVAPDGGRLSRTEITLSSPCTGVTVCATGTGYAMLYVLNNAGTHTAYLRTSSDFITWSAAGAVTLPGLTAGRAVRDVRLIRLAAGGYFLLFSYQSELTPSGSIYNLWYSTSADLNTWATCAAVTDTTNPARDYLRPDVTQTDDGRLFIAAQEQNTYLSITKSTSGWLINSDVRVDNLHIYNDDLYFLSSSATGEQTGVARVNLDSWTIEKFYGGNTTPAIPAYFLANNPGKSFGDAQRVIIVRDFGVCLIDFAADSVTSFLFRDATGLSKNVTWQNQMKQDWKVGGAQVSAAENRLYVAIPNLYSDDFTFGYIDLTQTGPEYAFTGLVYNTGLSTAWDHLFKHFPEQNLLLSCGANSLDNYAGSLVVWDTASNARWKWYRRSTHPEFPLCGFYDAVLVGDKIYATTRYSDQDDSPYKYGLAEIDLNTDQIYYHYPTFTAEKIWPGFLEGAGRYGRIFHNAAGNELILGGLTEPAVFNYAVNSWEWPGMGAEGPPSTSARWLATIYDPQRDVFIGGKSNNLYLLPRTGTANLLKYLHGEFGTGWTFGEPELLAYGYKNINPAVAEDEQNAVWAAWTSTSPTKRTIQWDKTGAQRNLTEYLTDELSAEWAIDAPGRLTFTLSHGHLFDPSNADSILNFYLDKGNKARLRFGERIGGAEYWADQGTYIVREVRLNYARGTYPLAEVVCEDVRCLWAMHQIGVAQALTQYPEEALAAIIKAETPATDDDLSFPTFAGRFVFDAQWLDAYLTDIVDDVCHRFGYFPTVGMDGKITARPISETAAVAHTYATTAELVNFTPDDSYSDLTNRITVTGQSLDDIEVLFAEERLDAFAGTVGWWGFRKDFERWYSTDKSRRARYPRLKVVETSTSILFHLAGKIRERISEVDPEDKYCVVEVSAPNLIPVLIGAIGLYFSAGKIGDAVAAFGAGYTQPVGRAIENVAVCLALMVLGSTGNFQYEIWGQPLGYVKRNYSASANDLDLQNRIGMVVEQKIEGFLCHSPAHCQAVADFELMLARLQRNRVNFSKIGHLQDEIGDTLSLPHPITNQATRIYAAHLRRRYKPAVDGDGYLLDEIEGWKC